MAKQYKCPGCNNITKFADHPCPNCKHSGNCYPEARLEHHTFGCRNCSYSFRDLECRNCGTKVSDRFIEEEPIEITVEDLKAWFYLGGIALLIYYVFLK